jgi:hypothetical protein
MEHVEEAVHALGYIKSEYVPDLAIVLEANFGTHPKAISVTYRKIGDQLSPQEKRSLGLRSNTLLFPRRVRKFDA